MTKTKSKPGLNDETARKSEDKVQRQHHAPSILAPITPRGFLPWARKRLPIVRDEFQHFTDRIFNFAEDELFSGDFKPATNVAESDNAIEISVDVPGFEPEDIDISVHHHTITIRSKRELECCEEGCGIVFHRMERCCGSFSRTFSLPCEVKQGSETATCRNGVLKIRIKKTGTAATRKIKVS